MPRFAWIRLIVLLFALPVASCFDAETDCPTCPPVDSGRIDVLLPQDGEADSAHVNLDGGARVTLRRGKRISFEGLSPGGHSIKVVRWYSDFGVITSTTSLVEIWLEKGETRVLVFHNNFPLVADAQWPGHAPGALAAGPTPGRAG
jgi:hypothetical protein